MKMWIQFNVRTNQCLNNIPEHKGSLFEQHTCAINVFFLFFLDLKHELNLV